MTKQTNQKEGLHLEMELLPAFDIISVIQEALLQARARYSGQQKTAPADHGPITPEDLIELIGEDEVRRLVNKVIPAELSPQWEQRVFAYVEELATSFLEEMTTPKLALLQQALRTRSSPEPEEAPWNIAQSLVAAARSTENRENQETLEDQATETVHTRHDASLERGIALRYRDGSMAFQPEGNKAPVDITNTKTAAIAAMLLAENHRLSRASAHAHAINEAAWGYRLRYYTPSCGHPERDHLHYREHVEAARRAADASLPEWEMYGEQMEILCFEDQSLLALVDLGGLTPECWEITDPLALQEALEEIRTTGQTKSKAHKREKQQ